MSSVVIVDYGVGNLLSVRRAIEFLGAEVVQTSDVNVIESASHLILPGVGAFGHCIEKLSNLGLVDPLKKYSFSGRPLLGICVGMQMLMEYGEEFGRHEGLGLIPGGVERIANTKINGEPHKIPHIGWNSIYPTDKSDWSGSPLKTTLPQEKFYFVHSYAPTLKNPQNLLAQCDYNGRKITSAIRVRNTFGLQFHPEKSGPTGLNVIKEFLSLRGVS